jgi:ABC-type bacteriocin/lantibiotic exporter with double-glycine peptidase domain
MGTFLNLNLRIESFYIYEITGTDLHAIFSPKGIDNFETDGISLEPFRGEIEFQDVRFTYPTNKDVVVSFMSSTGFPNKRCSLLIMRHVHEHRRFLITSTCGFLGAQKLLW